MPSGEEGKQWISGPRISGSCWHAEFVVQCRGWAADPADALLTVEGAKVNPEGALEKSSYATRHCFLALGSFGLFSVGLFSARF